MSQINWLEKLGWTEEELEDIRSTAYAYIRQGKYDIAIKFFEALAILDPQSAYDLQTLGALHLQEGNPTKAIRYLDRALKLEADHASTLINLTKAFFMLNRVEEGLKLANILQNDVDVTISNTAKALLLAYSHPKPVKKALSRKKSSS